MVFPLRHLTSGYMLPTSIASPQLSAPKHNYNSNTTVQPSSGSLKLRYMLGPISWEALHVLRVITGKAWRGPQATYSPRAFLEAVRYHASAVLSRFDSLRECAMALGMRLFLNLFDGSTVTTTTKRKAKCTLQKHDCQGTIREWESSLVIYYHAEVYEPRRNHSIFPGPPHISILAGKSPFPLFLYFHGNKGKTKTPTVHSL